MPDTEWRDTDAPLNHPSKGVSIGYRSDGSIRIKIKNYAPAQVTSLRLNSSDGRVQVDLRKKDA